jgi:cellulose synthase/poly-beta-1,6-N-acetylglucosamine synthase-like glycosyltransferase
MAMTVAMTVLMIAEAALLGVVAYLVLLVFAGAFVRRKPLAPARRMRRFAVIVPAHNEEAVVARTLVSLKEVDYPRSLFDVHVIADNCDDATATIAREYTPLVHERTDRTAMGKGQALRWLFDRLPADGYDAFAVIDADSVVSRNFLSAMNARLESGSLAVQSDYGVLHAERSWVSSLRAVAFCLLHRARRSGLSALGASAGLAGNGMVFSAELREAREWDAFGVTEDLELNAKLAMAGVKVGFAPEASVLGEMPATLAASRGQNMRWERGRLGLARRYAPRLIAAAFRGRDRSKLASGLDLLIPPLSVIGLAAVAFFCLSLHPVCCDGRPCAIATLLGLTTYVVGGLASAKAPFRLWLALFFAPVYAMWKGWLYAQALVARGAPSWTKTGRAEEASHGAEGGVT